MPMKNEDFLSSILDSAAHGIISTTTEGVITAFNKKAENMLGYSASELVLKETPAIFHDLDEVVLRSQQFSESLGEQIEPGFKTFVCHTDAGLKNEFEWTYVRKDGSKFPVLLSITQVLDSRNIKTGYLGIAQDLSEKKKLELENKKIRERVEEEKAKRFHSSKLASIGELAAGVGHEINNPLAIINASIQLAKKQHIAGKPIQTKRFDQIEDAVARIANIVDGLREFARSDADTFETFDVKKQLEKVVDLIKTIYRNEGVGINTEFTDERYFIKGVPGKLSQVIMNLLSNAKDALKTTNDPRITLSLESVKDQVIIKVADNGTGIPEAHQEKIFDSFYTTKPIGEGTGLGLGISREIVQKMLGSISFTSSREAGTVFTLNFPKSVEEKKSDGSLTKPAFSIESVKVLVVDDEPAIVELFGESLQDVGFIVEQAANGREALKKAKEQCFDLIITDLNMPQMSGIDLIKSCKEQLDIQPKYVLISGRLDISEDEKILEGIRPDVILKKPVLLDDLHVLVKLFQ